MRSFKDAAQSARGKICFIVLIFVDPITDGDNIDTSNWDVDLSLAGEDRKADRTGKGSTYLCCVVAKYC